MHLLLLPTIIPSPTFLVAVHSCAGNSGQYSLGPSFVVVVVVVVLSSTVQYLSSSRSALRK
jgi:hypothetical protein